MPAKTPIYLKTTTPKKGKRLKLRDVLSGDMISPPLGDVRHSAHVGPEGEGDMFGDVGFLRGKMDMLPVLSRQNGGSARSHSDGFSAQREEPGYDGFHYQHHCNGLLKTTVSMPVFVAHEQAPPKPPRLHLDEPAPPDPGRGWADGTQLLSLCENGGEPCRDASPSPAVRSLVPSSGSFSEVSSEDSVSESCGPAHVHRGLSLDSDAGLSNEDAGSDRSESPCAALHPAGLAPSSGVPRSDSMAVLDLDLGPSILEDVLGIMDRYKTVDNRCEL
ncbi:cdc42 effector protein 2 [Austrofundulus limnaeus]|uniref:Cdc42 effector protein 2 n=1 Tax=Austrofundulus limnaeus TaxID=52670 RepID=A0A2I4BUF6_AUSLI|nr:PREDICTED: cdc42 effector protein 2-like [Austrofundulus limnaeus]